MLSDDIGKVARVEYLFVAPGEGWLRRSVDNREKCKYYTSKHMRLMARLLIELTILMVKLMQMEHLTTEYLTMDLRKKNDNGKYDNGVSDNKSDNGASDNGVSDN